MTREELEGKVDEALSGHLAAEAWGALVEQKKAAAVSMAVSDIMGRVPGLAFPVPDAASPLLVSAVVEQALFLAFHYEPKSPPASSHRRAWTGLPSPTAPPPQLTIRPWPCVRGFTYSP